MTGMGAWVDGEGWGQVVGMRRICFRLSQPGMQCRVLAADDPVSPPRRIGSCGLCVCPAVVVLYWQFASFFFSFTILEEDGPAYRVKQNNFFPSLSGNLYHSANPDVDVTPHCF